MAGTNTNVAAHEPLASISLGAAARQLDIDFTWALLSAILAGVVLDLIAFCIGRVFFADETAILVPRTGLKRHLFIARILPGARWLIYARLGAKLQSPARCVLWTMVFNFVYWPIALGLCVAYAATLSALMWPIIIGTALISIASWWILWRDRTNLMP